MGVMDMLLFLRARPPNLLPYGPHLPPKLSTSGAVLKSLLHHLTSLTTKISLYLLPYVVSFLPSFLFLHTSFHLSPITPQEQIQICILLRSST